MGTSLTTYRIGSKLVSHWYQSGTRLVLDWANSLSFFCYPPAWHQFGTKLIPKLAPSWYELGTKQTCELNQTVDHATKLMPELVPCWYKLDTKQTCELNLTVDHARCPTN